VATPKGTARGECVDILCERSHSSNQTLAYQSIVFARTKRRETVSSQRWEQEPRALPFKRSPSREPDRERNGFTDALGTRAWSAAVQTIEIAAESEIGPDHGMTRYELWKKARAHCVTLSRSAVYEYPGGVRDIGVEHAEALMMAADLRVVGESRPKPKGPSAGHVTG
jgi:hypothetical protein